MIELEFVDVPNLNLNFVHKWISEVLKNENKQEGIISLVFGSDDWLLAKNVEFLQHDFYTDIITFDYCEGDFVSGDLLISVDRVNDNANIFNVSRETELNRVIIHGILHLCGYGDKSDLEIDIMRSKEDYYLSLL
ncbi:rRNA maturation RNase YbeY [Brumimicrobium salinarum]|uniref:Endoribonuclease YbeY n=1 Tax=Brumimicrobium salinarum TaxID=2058658 RepID=A0A2I0R690_9FLAO|nr:rRNA maturation RNase YbeY [Brumimicrobium salinarum]PKR82102.1 rRNA maturation RNase YbeY [Brumimicrobium salinarum]